MTIKAPFPWFGGKSRAAHLVWERFGDVSHYIEPFAGSLAVLLARPDDHQRKLETTNDLDCHLANLWRSVQMSPELVIDAADWPVSEADLHARHRYLVEWLTEERRERFMVDPFYHEPGLAGWWLWGICQWIGSQWCEKLYRRSPQLTNNDRGILAHGLRQPPKLGPARSGVTRKRPAIGACQNTPGNGIHGQGDWMDLIYALQERLRHVKIICGDWRRVVTPAAIGTVAMGARTAGILLDPPYSGETGRDKSIYAEESLSVAHDVRSWCLEHGDDPQLRIALCGLSGEHDELEEHGWEVVQWVASGGMGRGDDSEALKRRYLETIWFSPHCLDGRQGELF